MTVYRVEMPVDKTKTKVALVEARTEYDAKRYVADDLLENKGITATPDVVSTWTAVKEFAGVAWQ